MKDKFTPIHNDVMEALAKINLSPYEWRVLCAIFRKTYGFKDAAGERKRVDWIAYSQITEITGLDKRLIGRALAGLVKKKVISRDDKSLGFSKEFMKEKSSVEMTAENKESHQFCAQKSSISSTGQSSVEMNTKEKSLTKETKQKKELCPMATPEVLLSQAKSLLATLPPHLMVLFNDWIDLIKQQNKTGKVTPTRQAREWMELYSLCKGTPESGYFEYGLTEACKHQAPNINYVKAVIKGQRIKNEKVGHTPHWNIGDKVAQAKQ